ncbi:hypothetical protein D9M72_447360 [compost metagenome]
MPGDVATGGGDGLAAAEDDVLDFRAVNPRTLDGMLNGMARHGCAMGHVEGASGGFADRGAGK